MSRHHQQRILLFAPLAIVATLVLAWVVPPRSPSPWPGVAAPAEAAATTPTTAAPAGPTEPPATTPAPPPAQLQAPALPTGKGMWIWMPDQAEGGDVNAIVARAQATGLTHLYVRTGSSVDGFYAAPFLDALLPVAHAGGLKIIGWDFPYFSDIGADISRAVAAISYTTPTGDRLDGFSPDIETRFEGVWLSPENALLYGVGLRGAVGPSYPLIATVPRPSPARQADYPYTEVTASFDAIAPMVYWIDTPPDEDAAQAVDFLAAFGKPVYPIGQAYDGSLDGGPPGTPTGDEIGAFMNTSAAHGAKGVSFWSWQHASDAMWSAIASGPAVGVG
ncbi:MAG TPA: hypothetical protein VHI95_01450 [Acidimicrobiales bacterium]|nr:hypothetical protein [Acidimicrobiales bacterium]